MKKFFSVFMLLLVCLLAPAQELVMLLLTDNGQRVPVSEANFLLAADNDEEFAVVLNNGNAFSGVRRVTFELGEWTAVDNVRQEENIKVAVIEADNYLLLTGCAQGTPVQVFSLDGTLLSAVSAAEGTTRINLEAFTAGCYILRAGTSSVKFIKK